MPKLKSILINVFMLTPSGIVKYISYSCVIRYMFFHTDNRKSNDLNAHHNILVNQHLIYRHSGIILK